MPEDWLVGTWNLESYQLIGSRGRVRHPYGEAPVGYILYGIDGYMAVTIMRAGRSLSDASDILRRTTQEAADATRTYLSYAGTYDLFPDRLVHHVEISLFPNWSGTEQVRYFLLEGDRLELSTAPWADRGQVAHAHLVWTRVPRRTR